MEAFTVQVPPDTTYTGCERCRFRICIRSTFKVLATLAILLPNQLAAQKADDKLECPVPGSELIDPASYGFDLPIAEPVVSPFENVATRDQAGQRVIAKVQCKLGKHFVVMLPDGELVARKAEEVQGVEDKFVAASHDDVAAAQMKGMLRHFNYKKSRNYVYIYNTTEPFANACKSILESMYSGVVKEMEAQGLDTHDPEVPLVVIMFNRAEQFQAFNVSTMGHRMPQEVLAYYDTIKNRIILHEESSFAAARPDLARGQLLSTIAHEGAHQILHNIGVQQRLSLWPRWLSEGIAEYLAPTSFSKNNRWKGAGKINDLRMLELEVFLQSQYVKGFNGDSISGAVGARVLDSTGYATAWGITHYLARNKKKEFYEFLKMLGQLGPMRGMAADGDVIPANLEHFARFFGQDIASIEQDMVEHMSKQRYESPVGSFPHYVGMVQYPGNDMKPVRHACFFHNQDLVQQWRQVVEETMSAGQRREATWDIQQFVNRGQANRHIRQFLKK